MAGIVFHEKQCGYLAGYAAVMEGYTKLGFFVGVGVFDAEEYHHAGAYLAFDLASDGDGGGEATLDYYAHFFN